MRPRIVISHDHRLFVSGLELLVTPEFDVVLATTDVTATVGAVRDLRPDLLLLGLSNDPKAGLQIVSDVRALVPSTKIAIVTRWKDGALAADAFRHGALVATALNLFHKFAAVRRIKVTTSAELVRFAVEQRLV